MANKIFAATYSACQAITRTFDMVWGLDAGLWNLRLCTQHYYANHPDATECEVKEELTQGLSIHGLNLKRITDELSWDYEEQYIAELLLINATAIFDAWVDNFIDSTLLNVSKNKRKSIKKDVKKGTFSSFDLALTNEPSSPLSECFHITANRQDSYIENLRLIYKYFKSCRNCCAHGDRHFSSAAERDYNVIKDLTKQNCGLKEFPQIVESKENHPFVLCIRGVVGFYDILIRIINHYDILASNKIAVECELLNRWNSIQGVKLSRNVQKRNRSIRNYIKSVNMCPPYIEKTDDIYQFLLSKHAIK